MGETEDILIARTYFFKLKPWRYRKSAIVRQRIIFQKRAIILGSKTIMDWTKECKVNGTHGTEFQSTYGLFPQGLSDIYSDGWERYTGMALAERSGHGRLEGLIFELYVSEQRLVSSYHFRAGAYKGL